MSSIQAQIEILRNSYQSEYNNHCYEKHLMDKQIKILTDALKQITYESRHNAVKIATKALMDKGLVK